MLHACARIEVASRHGARRPKTTRAIKIL